MRGWEMLRRQKATPLIKKIKRGRAWGAGRARAGVGGHGEVGGHRLGGTGWGAQGLPRAQPGCGGALGVPLMFMFFPFPFSSPPFPFSFSSPSPFPLLSPFPEFSSQGLLGTRWSQLPPHPWEMPMPTKARAGLGLWVLLGSNSLFGEQRDGTKPPQGCPWEPWPAAVPGSSGATIGDPVGDTVGAVGAPRRRP